MKILTNKNILIISPESWGKSYLSKHFYALELLKHNNKVWFLNSPYYKRDAYAKSIEEQNPGLTIVDDEVLSGLIRMPAAIQRMLVRRQIKKLMHRCQTTWDIIWSFDNSRYFFLDAFGKETIRIHHVVDEHMDYALKTCCTTASLCLGVTPEIVSKCKSHNQRSFFLQHGFADYERKNISLEKGNEKIHVAYIGNLLLKTFDYELLIELAMKFTNVRFHLIGSYGSGNLNASFANNHIFIDTLKDLRNVVLYDERPYDEALTLASGADLLMLMYFDPEGNVAGNSSKILPYLSTGKTVISNYFELYDGLHLLSMVKKRATYAGLFEELISRIEEENSPGKMDVRIKYARLHSYERQLEKVDKLLSDLNR